MRLLKIATTVFALAGFCLPGAALSAENVVVSSQKLAQAARFLPDNKGLDVRRKAIAIILLAEYGRLLPANLDALQWGTLENTFLEGPVEESIRRQEADRLPAADTVSFDGVRLDGGGFARIDHILGLNGRPIAFDRRLPTRFIPLKPGEENRLQKAASDFAATSPAGDLQKRTDSLYRVPLAGLMVGDGLFSRPYAGRIDDLFYRLVQENPRPSTELDFYAIVESLPGRQYHPLTGIGASSSVPSPWFSLSETLSGGGLLAVETFKTRHPRIDLRNPFFGFAARVLPFLGRELANAKPGKEFILSKEIIREAFQNSRRFTPKPVPAIFNDPSHFFSALTPRFTLVARRLSRSRMAEEIKKIDFATPLPELAGDPAGNEVLAHPSQVPEGEYLQELPAILDLDATRQADDAPPVSSSPQALPITSEAHIDSPLVGSPPAAAEPPTAPATSPSGHYLAVVTPDIAASEKYLEAISFSDVLLAKNAASLQRVECYLKWLDAALEPLETYLQKAAGLAKRAELQAIVEAGQDQLASLLEQRHFLQNERGKFLRERARLRTEIEGAPLLRSISQLEALLGRPAPVSTSRKFAITFL